VVDYGMAMGLDLLRRYSDDELMELCRRNPGYEFERMPDGQLIVSPPVGWFSGSGEARLVGQLYAWNARAGGGGNVFGPSAGFRLRDKSLFAPDAAWLDREQFAQLQKQPRNKFARIAPTLVFEVVSDSDRLLLVRRKMEIYVRNGVARAIMIDPERRLVEVSSADALHVPWEDSSLLSIPLDVLSGAAEPLQIDLEQLF
jgi:Uma2 family endonuclease